MMMRHLAFLLLGIGIAGSSTTRAQPAEDMSANPIIREYRAKLPLLLERYSTNRKIRFRITRYVVDAKAGQRVGDETFTGVGEAITDGQQIKLVQSESKPAHSDEIAHFWRPDMRFQIARKGNAFKITEQSLASGNYHSQEFSKFPLNAHAPILTGGGGGTTLWFDERPQTQKSEITTVVGVKQATWKGRSCVEVRSKWDTRHGVVQLASTFLDPANDYISIGGETDWVVDPLSKQSAKRSVEIEYQQSPEGFPLPKSVRRTFQYKDGVARKVSDIEFLSYERYVPSPEEFQLEKPYGLVTPAEVPIAQNTALVPPAKQRRWWPWIVLGAGAVLAAVAVLLMRKTRRRESAASTAIGNPTP